jgi:hypothetical protein
MNDMNTSKIETSIGGNTKLCYYRNRGKKIQQIVVDGSWEKEKIIFPGEQLLFWAHPKDLLTIKILKSDDVVVDSIICEHLLAQ